MAEPRFTYRWFGSYRCLALWYFGCGSSSITWELVRHGIFSVIHSGPGVPRVTLMLLHIWGPAGLGGSTKSLAVETLATPGGEGFPAGADLGNLERGMCEDDPPAFSCRILCGHSWAGTRPGAPCVGWL